MAILKLSKTRISKLIAQGKRRKYGDGGKLCLDVKAPGVASWMLRWKVWDPLAKKYKEQRLTYGPCHTIDVDKARELAKADRNLLLQHKDPKAERAARELDEQIAQGLAPTVPQVTEEYDRDIVSHNAKN